MKYYILEGHITKPVGDLIEWANWFETANRHVADEIIDGVRVSTVFLGIDHSFCEGRPLLFETMAFKVGSWSELVAERYSTWEEAEAGHKEIVARVKRGLVWR